MTDIRSLERTLLDNLPWNKARIKFVARFLLALYAMRTVNLSILATASPQRRLTLKRHSELRAKVVAQTARRAATIDARGPGSIAQLHPEFVSLLESG
jgi:hypothetical protein